MNSEKKLFGSVDKKDVYLFTFTNDNGIQFSVTNYGGIVTKLLVPDKKGIMEDIVLGFDNLDQYVGDHPYFGALIGRFGNRIANGTFKLEGKKYVMAQNNGTNHLHGGLKGFDKVVWDSKEYRTNDSIGLEFTYLSKDGEEGYPGNLSVKVLCYLTNNDELVFDYTASTDKTTVVNLTHHGYFNLNGMKGNVKDHLMMINADQVTEINDNLIPTGQFQKVDGTPFDFKKPKKIGMEIEAAGGYDHNFILNKEVNELSLAARVSEENSGRIMEVFTTEPGMQFYSSNYLDGTLKGKNDIIYQKHWAFCLETQHYPDSPNHDHFPDTTLKAGEVFKTKTIYKFSTR